MIWAFPVFQGWELQPLVLEGFIWGAHGLAKFCLSSVYVGACGEIQTLAAAQTEMLIDTIVAM